MTAILTNSKPHNDTKVLMLTVVMNYSNFRKRETVFVLTCHHWHVTKNYGNTHTWYCNPLLNTVHVTPIRVTQFLVLVLASFSQSGHLLHYCIPAMDMDGFSLLLTLNTSAKVYVKNVMCINQILWHLLNVART